MSFLGIDDILNCAVEVISDALPESIRVIKKYPSFKKTFPLDKINVTCAFKKVSEKDVTQNGNTAISRECEFEIGVFVPFSMESITAYSVAEEVCEAMRASETFYSCEFEIGSITPDRTCNAFSIISSIKCVFNASQNEPENSLQTIVYADGALLRNVVKAVCSLKREESFVTEYGEDEAFAVIAGERKYKIELTLIGHVSGRQRIGELTVSYSSEASTYYDLVLCLSKYTVENNEGSRTVLTYYAVRKEG